MLVQARCNFNTVGGHFCTAEGVTPNSLTIIHRTPFPHQSGGGTQDGKGILWGHKNQEALLVSALAVAKVKLQIPKGPVCAEFRRSTVAVPFCLMK